MLLAWLDPRGETLLFPPLPTVLDNLEDHHLLLAPTQSGSASAGSVALHVQKIQRLG